MREACTSAAFSKEQASALVLPTARFINSCDKVQIQLAPEKLVSVCRRFKDHVMQLEAPLRGVAPMLTCRMPINDSFSFCVGKT
ncbi:COP9 signalosome complex subunit 3-like [Rosa rugosa]|uniref:COP9 signalosome complex subunit 3-like n=1 Tax=Rosa rugosa TaxID=74645 RepID=UPI002B40D872|nr:COP9 signalosome complex subunit 3-like [Rosa rugosa]